MSVGSAERVRGNLVGGEWTGGGAVSENLNPSNLADVVGRYEQGDAATAAEAAAAAAAAFPAWSRTGPAERALALEAIAAELDARREELGTLLAREEGKTRAEAVAEVARSAQIFRYYAGEALRAGGETLDSVRPGVEVSISREPVGPVALITPWNFPLAIPAWKLAPALAFGNTAVLKPAEQAPGCAWELADVASRAGLPPGVVNLVMGDGEVVGRQLVEAPEIAAVSFTGSTAVGREVAERCARRGARFQLEMGGKNPLVVLDDADLELAVAAAVQGAFFLTGQRCTASSRLVVTEGVHDAFVELLVERTRGLRVDDALAPGADLGPVVDSAQLEQDLSYLAIGREEGAEVVGGRRLGREREGYYLEPALLLGARNEMRTSREEIFGPVASVIRVADYEEALAVANDTELGLTAGICTRSLRHAHHFRRNAEAGMVMVNLPTAAVDYHVPFGGRKGSSSGPREQGAYARDFYTAVKTSYLAP